MGKGGYCEGRVGDKHGWFPYNVVLEEQKANKGLIIFSSCAYHLLSSTLVLSGGDDQQRSDHAGAALSTNITEEKKESSNNDHQDHTEADDISEEAETEQPETATQDR